MIEKTLVLLKPDCVARGLIGEILSRFEKTGLKIVSMKMSQASDELAKQHYPESIAQKHGEEVRNRIVSYIRQGPIIALILEGVNAIENVRKLVGETYPNEALPGTIRGDYAHISKNFANENKKDVKNLVHASANKEDAINEIKLWFTLEELHNYPHSLDNFTQ